MQAWSGGHKILLFRQSYALKHFVLELLDAIPKARTLEIVGFIRTLSLSTNIWKQILIQSLIILIYCNGICVMITWMSNEHKWNYHKVYQKVFRSFALGL